MEKPQRLNRKAVKDKYRKLSGATWDYLFDHEKENRLAECRTEEPGRLVFYSRAKIERWLVERAHYREEEFVGPSAIDQLLRMPMRQHLMVG